MKENQVAAITVDAAYKVHTRLGPGLLEEDRDSCFLCAFATWRAVLFIFWCRKDGVLKNLGDSNLFGHFPIPRAC